jgi:hypothetical protein
MQFIKLKYPILAATIILLAASSCQKVVDLKLDSAATQIVIEGNITNVRGPQFVTVSQSVPFTNSNTFPPVSGAAVTINDNKGNVYKLIESPAGTYVVSNLLGKPGTTYTLTVQINGNTYSASSTMPAPVFFQPLSYTDDTFKKDSKLISIHYQDPANIPNQYRFIMNVNGIQVKTIFDTDDTFTDGGMVDIDLYQSDFKIKTGDNVTVEEQGIDRNIFNYWFSLSQQQDNGAGGGTTPSNPPSNISNGALGYFSAHTTFVQGIVIP